MTDKKDNSKKIKQLSKKVGSILLPPKNFK